MNGKKITIHAGLHKTETSSIQAALFDSRFLLLENGILYPKFGGDRWKNHSVPLSLLFMDEENSGYPAVRNIFPDKNLQVAASEKIFQDFLLELIRYGEKNILLSAEDFSTFKKNERGRLKDFFSNLCDCEFEIVVYVREPIAYAISDAQELVRAGVKTIGEAIKIGNLQRAKARISNLIDIFGAESVKVFDYDGLDSAGGDVVRHFFTAVGLPFQAPVKEVGRANVSSTIERILVLSAIKKLDPSLLARVSSDLPHDGERTALGDKSRQVIWDACKSDVDFLRNEFGIDYKYKDVYTTCLSLTVLDSCVEIAMRHQGTLSRDEIIDAIVEDVKDVFPELIYDIVSLGNRK